MILPLFFGVSVAVAGLAVVMEENVATAKAVTVPVVVVPAIGVVGVVLEVQEVF